MMAKKPRYLDILLGSFVAIGFVLLVLAVFLLGRERRLFDTGTYLKAEYPNVAGLAVGAHVMLAGVYVGHVSSIEFPNYGKTLQQKISEGKVTVVMRVSSDMMQ